MTEKAAITPSIPANNIHKKPARVGSQIKKTDADCFEKKNPKRNNSLELFTGICGAFLFNFKPTNWCSGFLKMLLGDYLE